MERSTQAEARKEQFTKRGKIAKDLAELALAEIDEALLADEVILEGLRTAVEQNGMTEAEAKANYAAYMGTREIEPHSDLYKVWVASHEEPSSDGQQTLPYAW